MLTISKTTSGEYIKLTSDEITSFLGNISNYEELKIEMSLNCAPPLEIKYVLNTPISSCENSINELTGRGFWRLDLAYYKTNNIAMTKFIVKNINTGELSEYSTTIDWAQYNIDCPTGCSLESSGAFYPSAIHGAFDDAADEGGFNGNYSASACGDYIQLYTTDANNFPYAIEFANGERKLLSYSYSGIILDTDAIYVTSDFMGGDSIIDGVYRVKYTLKEENNSKTEDSSCFFLDNSTACDMVEKVASLLRETESEYKNNEHWMKLSAAHWGLTMASECHGCNCEDLCELYKEYLILYNKTKSIVNCAC